MFSLLARLTRGELFAGLCVLGFANGIVARVSYIILKDGAVSALLNTFGISVLVWIGFYACPTLMVQSVKKPARRDLIVAACALVVFMLPIHWLSWIALTAVALYLITARESLTPDSADEFSPTNRGGWVLLAITGAMFWGRVLLLAASNVSSRLTPFLLAGLRERHGWATRSSSRMEQVTFGSRHLALPLRTYRS